MSVIPPLCDVKGLSLQELESVFTGWGERAFHARQVFDWIYKRGVDDFSRMTNLPAALRARLQQQFSSAPCSIASHLTSKDGAEKFLFKLADGQCIEAVSIPASGRVTACVSSQAGCRWACRFCASGAAGFKRNLTTGEIVEELYRLKEHSRSHSVTHVVFMGTGEPFENYDAVMQAIRIMNAAPAFGIGARRITISTCGIIPGIKRLAGEGLQVELSVSLHAADDTLRSRLMPVNRKYPLKELLQACRQYNAATNRQVTFEYILMKGVNSDLLNARKLGTILQGFDSKVNLIAANPAGGAAYVPPAPAEIAAFKKTLVKAGIPVTLRASRGQDIQAACGQLRLNYGQK